jgi:FkbM family methyltransferase
MNQLLESASPTVGQRRDDREIVIYHVGGEGDYGPAMCVLRAAGPHVRLVVFEARTDTSDSNTSDNLNRDGIRTTVIFKGIDQEAGRTRFFVNKHLLSSSLLESSVLSAHESPAYDHCHTWSENSELDHVISVDTVSLDEIVAAGLAPAPDIISIDAQGAELRILRGASNTLKKTLCVVSEVEFFEIYAGQGLFDDQMTLLSHAGFRLFNIFNTQFWHPGPAAGDGFMTVGEAVFFRYAAQLPSLPDKRGYVSMASMETDELLRLSLIASAFKAHSYAYTIAKEVQARDAELFGRLRLDPQYQNVCKLVDRIDSGLAHYDKDPLHFLRPQPPSAAQGIWRLVTTRKFRNRVAVLRRRLGLLDADPEN